MNILISSSTLDVQNGYGNITYELVNQLNKKGHNVTLLLPEDDKFFKYDIPGVCIERVLPPYIFRLKSRHFFKYLTWSYKMKNSFDLVHSLFEFPYAPLICRLAEKNDLPFIIGAQGTYGVQPLVYFPERYLMLYTYKKAKAIHVPSLYTKNAINNEAGRNYDITIIHNGVDLERFSDNKNENILLGDEFNGKKILLTVGPLKNRKGQELVIRALPKVVKENPDVMYVMAGAPTDKDFIVSLAKELGVLEHIKIIGEIAREKIPDYFHACDVYVHTPRISNRFQFEGFGIVYLEASACGKPSVGADAGGITDALVHEKTGLVAPAEDVDKIAEYINLLLKNKELRERYGKAGIAYAQEHTWDHITDQYIDLYKSVVGLNK